MVKVPLDKLDDVRPLSWAPRGRKGQAEEEILKPGGLNTQARLNIMRHIADVYGGVPFETLHNLHEGTCTSMYIEFDHICHHPMQSMKCNDQALRRAKHNH